MKQKHTRILPLALSAAIAMPLALGTLSACKEDEKGDIAQSTADNSAAVAYSDFDSTTLTDGYAVNGLAKEIDYLLKLDADRLLADFRANAKLDTKGASAYGGGWEGALIGGHTLGHYLTAIAQAYKNPGTPEDKRAALKTRIDYLIGALQECQNAAEAAGAKKGFLWGAKVLSAANPEIQFDNVEKNKTNIVTEAWVPWYTMHKILAGLIDVYRYTDSAAALEVAKALGDWTYERVSKWTTAVQTTVLSIEYGGMNDALYNLYAVTGEKKYAVAAHQFDEIPLFNRILGGERDYLNDKHANTTIPKIIGALNRYLTVDGKTVEGETVDAGQMVDVAEEFWDRVVDSHTYVTGGNSEWEHFGKDDVLNAERTNCNCETCNTYNMLKLSRMLFTVTKNVKYLNFYENTYYNAIWSSQNPETGMTTYFQPMASGYFKVYSTEESNFWCCTGSGMESFSKLQDSIYYTAGNATYVSLYLDSSYKTEDVEFEQKADLENSDVVTFEVTKGATVLRLRRPDWTPVFQVKVGDRNVTVNDSDKFVSVDVKKGDTVTVTMKKTVTAHGLIDADDVYALKYGPFVLSAELGSEDMTTATTGVSVTIPKSAVKVRTLEASAEAGTVQTLMADIDAYTEKGPGNTFTIKGVNKSYTFSYHFRQYTQRYAIYLQYGDAGTVQEDVVPYSWERTDTVQPGYGQYEVDELHAMEDNGSVGATNDGTYRYAQAGGSFSYRMAVVKGEKNRLIVYLRKADDGKSLRISAGNTVLFGKTLNDNGNAAEYSVIVELPEEVVNAAEHITANGTEYDVITLKFEGMNGAESAKVCSYLYSEHFTFDETGARDSKLAYYVDCGDYDVYTLNAGEKFGMYNSVTEQVYGEDPYTGKKWGIVDGYASTGGGAAPNGVWTNSTWAQENLVTDADKAVSNRYTKNQTESGLARKLTYQFDLDDGNYTVKVYFTDPWGVSKDPTMRANGKAVLQNAQIGKELSVDVTVSGGSLTLEFTSENPCINLAYIIIAFA